jgi:hypothetical protein
MRRSLAAITLVLLPLAATLTAHAQEMEPRAYSASPVGTNFVAVSLGSSSGSVIFDPTIPITDVSADVVSAGVGYGRTFGLWKRQGLFTFSVPYVLGHMEGLVGETQQKIRRSGLADLRAKVSYNIIGAPALTPGEFAKTKPSTIFGVSLTVQAPTGQYNPEKLINVGTNRWAFKPELGVSVPVKHWYFDAYLGAWFFLDNDAFYTGTSTKKQDPLASLQLHVSYSFKPRLWLALDATWYGGGQVTVDSNPPSERQNNSRLGLTFSCPVAKRQSIKLAAGTGASARTGADFNTLLVAWQFAWFDRPKAPPPVKTPPAP